MNPEAKTVKIIIAALSIVVFATALWANILTIKVNTRALKQ